MKNFNSNCRSYHRRYQQQRGGYTLVMCLLVVGVSSAIVLSLFQVVRLQTAEATARRQQVIAESLSDAGVEHAIAVLLDQPSFRGTIGPVVPPNDPQRSYTIRMIDVSGDVQVDVLAQAGNSRAAMSKLIPASKLSERRARLSL
ncbi:MAG: hypothetical protein R3C53_18620 [Pirellulaceae bacterium]